MPNYKGRRKGTRRVVLSVRGIPREWIVEGTKKDADEFEAKKRIEIQAGTLSTRVSPTLKEFCAKVYAPHAVDHLQASTWYVRVYQIKALVRHLGGKRLVELTEDAIATYKSARVREGVLPGTVNNELNILTTIVRFAIRRGYPAAAPKWQRFPRAAKGRARAWTTEEVTKILAATREAAPEIRPLLVFMLNTGVRKGEALACEWSWIDHEAGLLRIPVTASFQPKDKEAREVPLGKAALAALDEQVGKNDRWVFPNSLGGRFVRFPFVKLCRTLDAAQVKGHVHMTRHTYASHFLRACPDMPLLARILGHSTTYMTELYSHMLPGHLALGRDAVNLGSDPIVAADVAPKSKRPRSKPKTR